MNRWWKQSLVAPQIKYLHQLHWYILRPNTCSRAYVRAQKQSHLFHSSTATTRNPDFQRSSHTLALVSQCHRSNPRRRSTRWGKLKTTLGFRGLPSAASSRNITTHFQQPLSQILIMSQLKEWSGYAGLRLDQRLLSNLQITWQQDSETSPEAVFPQLCRQHLLSYAVKMSFFFYLASVSSLSHSADLIITLTGSPLSGQRP